MVRPWGKILVPAMALALGAPCATVPATLAPSDLEVCAVTHGDPFRFVICAERGRPRILGQDLVSPNLWLRLDTRDSTMGDFRDWELTVTHDGVVIRHGPLPPAPQASTYSAAGSQITTFVRLPGARWTPGRYRVDLSWTLDPYKHVAAEFVVPRTAHGRPMTNR